MKKKMRDLTIAQIRHACSSKNNCEMCPLHTYKSTRLCDIALRTRDLTDQELETMYD